jgi:hypothetical protein
MSNQENSMSEEENKVEPNTSAVSKASDNTKADETVNGSSESEDPEPFVKCEPGEIITAMGWNNMQIRAREEIRSHRHTSGKQGTQLSGEAIKSDSEVTLKNLSVENGFIMGFSPLFHKTLEIQDQEAVELLKNKPSGTFLIAGPCEDPDKDGGYNSFRIYWKATEEQFRRFDIFNTRGMKTIKTIDASGQVVPQ